MFMALETTVQLAVVGLLSTLGTAAGAVIIAKLNSIHTLANSNLQAANARLDKALEEIKKMHDQLATIATNVVISGKQPQAQPMPAVPILPVAPVMSQSQPKGGDMMEVKGTVQVQGTIPVEGEVMIPGVSEPKPKHK